MSTPATPTPPATFPVCPPPSYADTAPSLRLATAYRLLGITRDDVRHYPYITPQLMAIARLLRRHRHHTHARTFLISYLRTAADPDVARFFSAFDSLPAVWARILPIEAFCVAAGVAPFRLLEVFTSTVVRNGAQASAIIAATMHPSVMEATVRSALSDGPDAHADRVVLHRITGSLPQPKGAQTIIQLSQSQGQAQVAQAAAEVSAPPPESTIRRFIDRFNDARGQSPRQLPAASHAVMLDDVMDTSPAAAEPAEPAFRVPVPLSRRPMPEIVMDAEPGEDDEADAGADARED